MLINGIRAKAKIAHDLLTDLYYRPPEDLPTEDRITKEEFDLQHAKIWTDMHTQLLTEGYITPPQPSRLDLLEDRIKALETKEVL